ncbi:hypothetical protein ATCV1_z732R [Acanthocystis turfacea chlorella virus 1]|uniref:Uncharacterized protein z732R n=1 Tax=Chlorovirus heliozoae TaxID=322019 RepID=A7K9Z2_9PHYC|nr:hypothetical protein ATCV1_z732R [Acanthocystis turfacea chlorella virus 1]ABT16866.1 hypothetical protein ATCV1_z732R [Acanthocystis turfacea chlorella virus 1]
MLRKYSMMWLLCVCRNTCLGSWSNVMTRFARSALLMNPASSEKFSASSWRLRILSVSSLWENQNSSLSKNSLTNSRTASIVFLQTDNRFAFCNILGPRVN